MSEGRGVLRSKSSLAATAARSTSWQPCRSRGPGPAAWEATGLHQVATALVAAAAQREETRGAHWRDDHPEASDAWLATS
jgi:aspartate oxidase